MLFRLVAVAVFIFLPAWQVSAQEYTVSAAEAAPTGTLAPEISSLLDAKGIKVSKGSTVVCELWLAKEWPVEASAAPGGEVIYPLTVGEIIGAIRFAKKAGDFRGQDVPAGVYTLRYAQQPVDGAHVGTSPTRDFLAMSPAAKDRDPKKIDYKALVNVSKETIGAAHPGILSLQRVEGDGASPSVREVSDKEWVIVHAVGKMKQGGSVKELPIDLVVVGKAAE